MITIVDYKVANIGSIVNMFKRIGMPVQVAQKPIDLKLASHIVLPGIGHFDTCARNLRQFGFVDILTTLVLEQHVPLLGICVGAQLLTSGSEEGNEPGLGWIEAVTLKFPEVEKYGCKIPHMGWNHVAPTRSHYLFSHSEESVRFYFVHSYRMHCNDQASVLSRTTHGIEFASAIAKDNMVGVQFHPEKSHRFGMQLLRNFVAPISS